MSTTMLASASGRKSSPHAGLVGDPCNVIFASSRVAVTPETTTASMAFSSGTTQVPSLSLKLERTWIGTSYFMPNSTERICSTFAPSEASSSISS